MKFVNFNLGVAFDGSKIRGKSLDEKNHLNINNVVCTGHSENIDLDYKLFTDIGINFFRDSSFLDLTCPKKNIYNWDYLDKIAKQSRDNIQISLCHYEFPEWINGNPLDSNEFLDFLTDFAYNFSRRYTNQFHSVIPIVELSYWCHMISTLKRWYPYEDRWWKSFTYLSRVNIECAKILRSFNIDVAMSEPYGFSAPFEDRIRPFATLMGLNDKQADIEFSDSYKYGDYNLLQIIGLNFYDLEFIENYTIEIKNKFPDKEIIIAETGNAWHNNITPLEWLQKIDNYGSIVDTVIWSPAIEMCGFEYGNRVGGYILNQSRNKFTL